MNDCVNLPTQCAWTEGANVRLDSACKKTHAVCIASDFNATIVLTVLIIRVYDLLLNVTYHCICFVLCISN